MLIINATPHPLSIRGCDGSIFTIEPCGQVARVSSTKKLVDEVNGIAVYEEVFGEVQGLPEKQDGTLIVVSRLVAAATKDRDDLVVPGTLLRDENGAVIGADGLCRI